MRRLYLRITAVVGAVLGFVIVTSAFAQQCPANAHVTNITQEGNKRTVHCKCDDGYEPQNGTCQRSVQGAETNSHCIANAGRQLSQDLKVGCAREMGNCLRRKNVDLDQALVSCVATCETAAGCLSGCGIASASATQIVLQCVDENTSCKEAALARHKQAVAACR